jgi:hypothetical protein
VARPLRRPAGRGFLTRDDSGADEHHGQPPAFLYRYHTWKEVWPRLLTFAAPFAVGLLPFLLLPYLSLDEHPPNWLYPLTARKVWEHSNGARYHEWFASALGFRRNLPIFLRLPGQFGYLGFLPALVGAVWLAMTATHLFVVTAVLFLTTFC